jgi:hypothetical protein
VKLDAFNAILEANAHSGSATVPFVRSVHAQRAAAQLRYVLSGFIYLAVLNRMHTGSDR